MNSMFQQMKDAVNVSGVKISFDPARLPREQVKGAIAKLPPRSCDHHPHELRPVDILASGQEALRIYDGPYEHHALTEFHATYDRCLRCPHSDTDHDIEVKDCPVELVYFGKRDFSARDEKGRPVPQQVGSAHIDLNRSANEQFNAWLDAYGEIQCKLSNQALRRRSATLRPQIESLIIQPQFAPCLQCGLECLGITPDEARASFDNLVIDLPALREILEKCRAFAAAPKGVLLMLGNTGTGKTHLAIAIMREFLRRREYHLHFIKHRRFLAQHWQSLRPVPFGEEAPVSPLAACQASALLVYDEFTATTDNSRAHEDVLLDLFERRNGNYKPSIITANISRDDLEAALGSKLLDRLRRAAFAVLEFGFDSKRPALNADYLNRIRPK